MSKMKAVVLEKSGSRYIVLGKNGSFRQVHRRRNAEVGEEIEIRTGIVGFDGLRVWAGAAAIFFLVLTSIFSWSLYQPPTAVALLSVDINPSLQFTIDAQGHLLKFQTQNDDARRMLKQVNLIGKPIDEVLGQIITLAYNQNFLNSEQHWVVVGYSPMTDKSSEQMPKELNENQIITWVKGTIEEKGFTPQVAVFPLTSQESELAEKGNLTLGEYALLETAQKAGVVTQPEKIKDTSERVQLLDNPHVQAQIQSEKKEIESGRPRKSGSTKQDSGSIDKQYNKDTGKPMSVEPPSFLHRVPKNSATKMEKENNNDETMQKDKGKDHGQADTKEQDKGRNDANKEDIVRKKQNSKRDEFRIPETPERLQGEISNKNGLKQR